MNIISVSLTEKNLSDLDRIKKERGLANSSEAVRSALNDAIEQIDSEKGFSGNMNAVLVVNHSHATEKSVSQAKHAFQALVKSQSHYCTTGDKCIDMFFLSGSAEKIKKMKNMLLKNKKIQKTALVLL